MKQLLTLIFSLSLNSLGVVDACTVGNLTNDLAGVLRTAFLNAGSQGVENPMVSVTQHQVVCLTTGMTRGTYNFASVIASFTCTGLACPVNNLQQLDLSCDPGLTNTWTPVTFAAPIGDLTTTLRTDCGHCVQNGAALGSRFDNVTHCIACVSSCNIGLMECTDTMESGCCNGVVNNMCVGNCTAPNRPLESANYECTTFCDSLSNPANGNIIFTSGILVGSVATYVCDANFALQGSSTNRTCELGGSTTSWSDTAPSCVRVASEAPTMQGSTSPVNTGSEVTVELTPDSTDDNNSLSVGAIIGIVIAVIIVLLIVVVVIVAVLFIALRK